MLQRKHRETFIQKQNEKQGSPKETATDQPKISSFSSRNEKYLPSHPKQHHVTNSLIKFVAGGLMPLSIVDSQDFRSLCSALDPKYKMPDRKTFSRQILREKAIEVQSNLKHQLKQVESVALTLDLWSSRQMRGFIGITGHFIMNWTLKTVMVACKRVRGSHTAVKIREEYEECVACFSIGDKISCIITDNAANMTKAFDSDLPGFCKDDDSSTDEDDDEDDEDDEGADELDETEAGSLLKEVNVPKHRHCFAHTIQLVVKDGLKEISQSLQNTIAKTSKIVSFARHSVLASDMLEGEKRLQTANVTRWNSQLQMIRSVLDIPEEKLNSICRIKLSKYERKLLFELCKMLRPFEATIRIQTDSNVSASLTIPLIIGLKQSVEKIIAKYDNGMTQTFKTSLEKRCNVYEKDNIFRMAAILDPRFRLHWCEQEKIADMTEILLVEASRFYSSTDQKEEHSLPAKCSKELDDDGDSDLFSFMTPTKRRRHQSAPDTIQCEVNTYLMEENEALGSDPLVYWKKNETKYPIVSRMAKYFLSIPSSSAPVERLFSFAGKIFRPERCRLTDERFNDLMMLKCNADL